MDIRITMTETEGAGRRTEAAVSVSEADIRAFVLTVMAGLREAESVRNFNNTFKNGANNRGSGEHHLRDVLRRAGERPKADNPGKVPPVDHSTMGLSPGFTAARDFPPGLLEALKGLGQPLEGLAGMVVLG